MFPDQSQSLQICRRQPSFHMGVKPCRTHIRPYIKVPGSQKTVLLPAFLQETERTEETRDMVGGRHIRTHINVGPGRDDISLFHHSQCMQIHPVQPAAYVPVDRLRTYPAFVGEVAAQHPVRALYMCRQLLAMLRDVTVQSVKHVFPIFKPADTQA